MLARSPGRSSGAEVRPIGSARGVWRGMLGLCVMVVVAILPPARPLAGEYRQIELEEIPIERLIDNLETQVKAHNSPTYANSLLNLARAHGMAYSKKSDKVQIVKGQPQHGAWFGYEPEHVPFANVKPAANEQEKRDAKSHLDKAIEAYKECVRVDSKNFTARLGLAWCLIQDGDTIDSEKILRELIDDAWKVEEKLKGADAGWHSVVAEAASYLIPRLDTSSTLNQEYIKDLKEKVDKVAKIPRAVTPIAIPLRAGLTWDDIEDRTAAVAFDADGTGLVRRWSWIRPSAGWLVFDPNKRGRITSALQMFGSVTFWTFWDNGYEALRALDDNHDGELRAAELSGLALWVDANSNGVSEPGEVRPVAEYGITALSCRGQLDAAHPDRAVFSPSGVTFSDGTTRATFDVVLHQH